MKTRIEKSQWSPPGNYCLPTRTIRTFLAEDSPLLMALLARIVSKDKRVFIVGSATDGRKAVCNALTLEPDLVITDYRPYQSVNFITAHDGFCLYDLVAYNQKHNAANGHNNSDGTDHNLSWNCGWEGDVNTPAEVLALRRRQVKNFFCLLMLSNGTPMFCAGDEFLNTQRGNNNPYNQDNETTWLDWSKLEQNRDVFQFFQRMIAFRKAHPAIASGRYWREAVRWYGATGPVDFASRCLAYCLRGASDLYVMINAFWEPVRFHIQQPGPWNCVVDTSRHDLATRAVAGLNYEVAPRSVVVLERA